ncbi:DNA-binding HTH -containing domain protein [Yersinia pseudotuberculosis]|nr:DNA-binding HTH -containing domain protein [Yersinia pseudotuberculosis]
MDCHVNANATLADDADWHTKMVFIDADSSYCHRTLEQTYQAYKNQQSGTPGIFIILRSKGALLPLNMSYNTSAHILYKSDEQADIKSKIGVVIKNALGLKNTINPTV